MAPRTARLRAALGLFLIAIPAWECASHGDAPEPFTVFSDTIAGTPSAGAPSYVYDVVGDGPMLAAPLADPHGHDRRLVLTVTVKPSCSDDRL